MDQPNHAAPQPQGDRSAPRPRQSAQRRRRRRGRSRMVVTLLYVAVVIGVSALLATLGWIAATDVLALNKADRAAIITLPEDIFTTKEVTGEEKNKATGKVEKVTYTVQVADMGYVTNLLKEKGMIEFPFLFQLYAGFSDAGEKVSPGTYELNTDMDYRAIVTNLGPKSSSRSTVTVTIPEGFTVEQVFQRLEENGVSTVEKLNDMAASHDYAFSFLADIPLGDPRRLEGFLFPDTYSFYMGEDPLTVINKMLVNFDRRYTEAMREQTAEMGYSVQDILKVASMIEKETDGTDRSRIAGVIYNRLKNTSAETAGMLGIDATLVYGLGRTITQADYTANTPYNTYTIPGLPPTPIANPGMDSILAALNPESHDYYYYVLGNDKLHHFFRTHQGQLEFIAEQAG